MLFENIFSYFAQKNKADIPYDSWNHMKCEAIFSGENYKKKKKKEKKKEQ